MRDVLGSAEAAHASASEPIRRLDHALVWGPVTGGLVFAVGATVLWHIGAPPALSILDSIRLSGRCVLFVATMGREHSDAWSTMFHASGVLWRMLVAGAVGGVVGVKVFKTALKPQSRERHIDGIRLLTGEDAVVAARYQATAGGEGFLHIHPDYFAPKTQITKHMLIVGSIGGGKTQIILPMVDQLSNMGSRGHGKKMFIYDVKGDFVTAFPKAALVNPYDARSYYWDIAADITTTAAASTLASSLIPQKSEGDFWTQSAQQILIGVLRFLMSLREQNGQHWGWRTLARVLASDAHTLQRLMSAHYPQALRLLADPTSNSALDLLKTLAAHTRVIDTLGEAWGDGQGMRKLSLTAWARDDYRGRRQIIVQATPDKALTSTYIASMVNVLIPVIISPALPDNEQERSLIFVLDELPSLGRIELGPLLDKGRSKGVTCILGLQDLAQVRELYGNNFTQSLQSMVGTQILCKLNPGETRDSISSMLGKRRVAVTAHSHSAGQQAPSIAQHEEMRSVVAPGQLTELGLRRGKQWKHGFAVRAILSCGGDLLQLDWPGVIFPAARKGFVPAEWTKRLPAPIPVVLDQREPPPDPVIPASGGGRKRDGGLEAFAAKKAAEKDLSR